jgi:hypothetical protein
MAQARHFLHSLDAGHAGVADGRHGLAVVRTLEAISASMRANGTPVDVPAPAHVHSNA